MKKIRFVVMGLLFCIFVLLSFGCGQQLSNVNNNNNNSSGGTHVVGTLVTGTYSTSSVGKINKFSAVEEDTKVLLTNVDTGETIGGETNASGEFDVTVPTAQIGDSFMMTVIGKDSTIADGKGGPVVIDGDVNGKLGMGFVVSGSVEMDQVVFDSTKGAAVVASSDAVIDPDVVSDKEQDGTPPATGINLGSEPVNNQSSVDTTKVDSDFDGLPNVVDVDNDGDGVRDELDSNDASKEMPASVFGGHLAFFSNLKIGHESIDNPSTWQPVMTVEFVLEGASVLSDYTSVKIVDGPSWLSSASTFGLNKFSSTTFDLAPNSSVTPNRFNVFLQVPLGMAKAGDVLKFEIKKADGTTEYFMKMLNFVFSNPPVIQTIDGTALDTTNVTPQSPGTTSFPFQISQGALSHLTIVWKAPLDEDGNPILGMRKVWTYSIHKISDPNNDVSGFLDCDSATETSGGVITYMSDMQTVAQDKGVNVSDIESIKIDVEADSPVGDNTSHMIWIKP